jgi:hypothetical protein
MVSRRVGNCLMAPPEEEWYSWARATTPFAGHRACHPDVQIRHA